MIGALKSLGVKRPLPDRGQVTTFLPSLAGVYAKPQLGELMIQTRMKRTTLEFKCHRGVLDAVLTLTEGCWIFLRS